MISRSSFVPFVLYRRGVADVGPRIKLNDGIVRSDLHNSRQLFHLHPVRKGTNPKVSLILMQRLPRDSAHTRHLKFKPIDYRLEYLCIESAWRHVASASSLLAFGDIRMGNVRGTNTPSSWTRKNDVPGDNFVVSRENKIAPRFATAMLEQ